MSAMILAIIINRNGCQSERYVKGMAKVKFRVTCTAVYSSKLEIPKEIVNDKDAVLKYIHEHLNDCNVEDLEWLSDFEPEEAVTQKDIQYVEAE